jgi:uncharacterized protein (UPF0261 family)
VVRPEYNCGEPETIVAFCEVTNDAPTVVLIGTLDTKGAEIAYVRDRIREAGLQTCVLDAGILGEAMGIAPDISRQEVARASGTNIDQVRNAGSRGAAVEEMMRGVAAVCRRLHAEGRCHGVISLGGAEGAVLAGAGMQVLPVGIPKLIVTPLASGRRQFGPFVGIRDVMVMHAVIDILGLNAVSKLIFNQAAGAISGAVQAMARAAKPTGIEAKKVVGLTMLGNTTKAVEAIKLQLDAKGYEPIIFHSNGVGGAAMEEMIREGRIGAVIDYTTNELTDHLVGGFQDAGPQRLKAAGAAGLPQVVVPGCVDFFVQGPRTSIPEQWRDRPTYYHNPSFTLIRASRGEMLEVACRMADKLNAAEGPVAVAIPTGGLSIPNKPGGEFWDPEGDAAFRTALKKGLRKQIRCVEVDTHVNTKEMADAVVRLFFEVTS